MKRSCYLLLMAMCLCFSTQAQEATFETATEAVANMKIGWNLGNSLDSHASGVTGVTETEILRGQPVTSPELMEMMKLAGFNVIRVPVTWYPHMDEEGTVSAEWMARVREVVDYVLDEGMYCILDVHHDTGKSDANAPDKGWIRATMANYNSQKDRFAYLWQQIATEFRDYDQRLIFEGYNEMLDDFNSYNFASFKHENRYDATSAQDSYDAVNSYARLFVETVRATGGNNQQRNLLVNTYGGCSGYGTWISYLSEPLTKMQKPENSNHIIIGVHAYPQILSSTDNSELPMGGLQEQMDDMMRKLKTNFIDKGTPVIIGELGTANVDKSPNDYDAHRAHMLLFMRNFVEYAKYYKMPTLYWMGLSHKDYRSMPAFNQADLAETLLKQYYGWNTYKPQLLTPSDYSLSYDVNFANVWGELQLAYDANGLATNYAGMEVEFDDISAINGGLLTFRTYSTMANSPYTNYCDITEHSYAFNFDEIDPVRITIVWRTSGRACPISIRSVKMIRRDGTKEEAAVSIKTPERATMTTKSVPLYGKAKIKVENHATLYYGDRNLVVPEDITATAYKIAGGHLTAVKTYQPGSVIPAATGVVVEGENNRTYIFYPTDEVGELPTGSMMRGTDEDELTTGGDKYYMLSLDKDSTPGTVGFYYGAPDGAAFINKAHKAYLAVPAAEASADHFLLDEATGIENHTYTNDIRNAKGWYTISGMPLSVKPTKKGVYIFDGRKVVVE